MLLQNLKGKPLKFQNLPVDNIIETEFRHGSKFNKFNENIFQNTGFIF